MDGPENSHVVLERMKPNVIEHDYVQTVARRSGSNFYVSFFSLPKDQREAITAVYAFCREVDDAVDDPKNETPAASVARWRAEIANTYDGQPTLPLTQSLAQAIERFDLTRSYFEGILNGVAMDLDVASYATFEQLSTYCYHVAGEVGLLCMEIFGYRSERLKTYAVKLGTALQLTNILRDVASDIRRGRLYIPQEDLKRFGVSEDQIRGWADPRSSSCLRIDGTLGARRVVRWEGSHGWPAFHNLMAFESRRARDYYRDASLLPTTQERPSLRAAEIMRAVYENILKRIEQRNYNVFRSRIRVPTVAKLGLAARAWWSCR